jgi:hypothetical protein
MQLLQNKIRGDRLRYLIYLGRWQLSTPILALVMTKMAVGSGTTKVIVANLIGGLIFYWIDKFIFRK